MRIRGAKVYTEKHIFEERDIFISGERISYFDDEGFVMEAQGLYAVPGLVDIHLHGAAGRDLCERNREALDMITDYEAGRGVLALCSATAALPKEEIMDVLRFLGEYESSEGAYIAGINLEGPFISPLKTGALDAANVLPFDIRLFDSFQKAAKGKIRLLDLAPECMPDMDDVSKLSEDVHVSLAHTDCGYDAAKKAFQLGADHLTHAFNAMNGIGHRKPGPIMAAAEAGAFAEIIADGVHIHPSVVKLALKILGEDRVVFVSDSMMAAGMPDGEYSLGGKSVLVSGGKAVLKEDPSVIAGSAVDLLECVKRAVAMGIPFETAIRCASENPARSIGLEKDFGTLSPGAYANVLLLDEELNIRGVINRGFMLGEHRI